MNTTHTQATLPEGPAPYGRFEETSPHRPAVEFVAGTGTVTEYQLVPLLRKRLLFLVLVFAVFYGTLVPLWLYSTPISSWPTDAWIPVASTPYFLALAWLLASRVPLTLRQLRGVEFLLFAALVIRLVLRGYSLMWERYNVGQSLIWLAEGQIQFAHDNLLSVAFRLTVLSTIFLVAYGVIVPNNWRRCAIVVGLYALLPLLIWVVGCACRDLPVQHWFPLGVIVAFMLLFQSAAIAVYGAYRIESSRQEVAEARRLGQYVLREKLGGGGMGEVFLADHVLLRRPCAIKLIRPERAGDPAMLQRFEREVQATAMLTHPNAVQVFDYGHTPDGTFYYVMEHLPGPTLDELVKRDGPLPPHRAVHFLRQLCGALTEAHAVGLIHRDIKPSNVIVCERGRVPDVAKLLDFGLVQSAVVDGGDDKLTQVGTVLGTPAFLAPEQAAGEAVDARSDIYSLGALAYFLLTGQSPFAGKSPVKMLAAHMYETPVSLRVLRADIPAELEAIVLRCLAKTPGERFSDVQELDCALARCC